MEFTDKELDVQKALVERLRSGVFSMESELRAMMQTAESRKRSLGALQMELVIESKILKKMEDSRGARGQVGSVREQSGDQPDGGVE